MSEWISVKDRLPEKRTDVLVFYSNGEISIDWCDSCDCFCYETIYGKVTHWQPLPEPPKGE